MGWGDVELAAGTIRVARSLGWVKNKPFIKEPKSRAGRRTVTLPRFALAALAAHREEVVRAGPASGPAFCSSTGGYLDKKNVLNRYFRPAAKRANAAEAERATAAGEPADLIPVGLRFHDLRHSHASGLIASGLSVKAVSARLGHADVAVTLRVYAHLMPGDDGRLAEAAETLYG